MGGLKYKKDFYNNQDWFKRNLLSIKNSKLIMNITLPNQQFQVQSSCNRALNIIIDSKSVVLGLEDPNFPGLFCQILY